MLICSNESLINLRDSLSELDCFQTVIHANSYPSTPTKLYDKEAQKL